MRQAKNQSHRQSTLCFFDVGRGGRSLGETRQGRVQFCFRSAICGGSPAGWLEEPTGNLHHIILMDRVEFSTLWVPSPYCTTRQSRSEEGFFVCLSFALTRDRLWVAGTDLRAYGGVARMRQDGTTHSVDKEINIRGRWAVDTKHNATFATGPGP